MKKLVIAVLVIIALLPDWTIAQYNYAVWESNLQNSLKSANPESIKDFFSSDFADDEIESWKYNYKRGFLNFDSTKIFRLSEEAILFFIPTDNKPYSNDNEDSYFDFIYRIYRIKRTNAGYKIIGRCMDDYNPDFLSCANRIEVVPEEKEFFVESEVKVILKSSHLIFKLAKEFVLQDVKVNGVDVDYDRFGYFLHIAVNNADTIKFTVKGKIKAPQDNNQLFSMGNNKFFLRAGGLAVFPSPPPCNNGRYFFSKDETVFDMTFIYPAEYKLLQYG